MTHHFIGIAFTLGLCVATTASAQPAAEKPMECVGEVFIVGNSITQDRVIVGCLEGIVPGHILERSKLRAAERNLASLGIFKFDPARKIRPTVKVIECKGPFKDILVRVEEASSRQLKLDARVNSMGHPIVRLVMSDRNFDPYRWPTSMADFEKDRAFRGGGQTVHLELIRVDLFSAQVKLFSAGLLIPVMVRPLYENAK